MPDEPRQQLPDDVRQHRDWLLSLVTVPDGEALVVDLGCGRGDDLLALAARHRGPGARFVGVDASAKSVAAAAERAAGDARVAFRQHRLAGRLPFDDASVDVVYSHNLVECLADRDAFAREVARVLRPGGLAVIAHWDFDSQTFDGGDKELVRRLVHAFADRQQAWMDHADGWMGRRLWGTFAPTGAFDGTMHARVLTNTVYEPPWYGHAMAQSLAGLARHGLAPREECERFAAEQAALARAEQYFYSIAGYAFVGRRKTANTSC
jgi:SAM-dependent methyltransferase